MTTTAIDLFTTATYADLRLAMMQAGDQFTITALGAELDCDCSMDPDIHTIRPAAWAQAVEEYATANLVDVDGLWFRARVNDALTRNAESEASEAFHPLTAEALRAGVTEYEAWVKAEGWQCGLEA